MSSANGDFDVPLDEYIVPLISMVLAAVTPTSLSAQQSNTRLSTAEKCQIYKTVFDEVMRNSITHQLSDKFKSENIAFIQSGCIDYAYVCPRSIYDFAAANEITVATMNKGLASTFVPFKCPKMQ